MNKTIRKIIVIILLVSSVFSLTAGALTGLDYTIMPRLNGNRTLLAIKEISIVAYSVGYTIALLLWLVGKAFEGRKD